MDLFKLIQSLEGPGRTGKGKSTPDSNYNRNSNQPNQRFIPEPQIKVELPGIGHLFSLGLDLGAGRKTNRPSPAPSTFSSSFKKGTGRNLNQRKSVGAKLRYDILTRDNYRCQKCGATQKEAPLEVDHKIPVSHGGSNHPSNLQILCRRCNIGKGARRG